MGVIQNSFNQLLGIGALATGTVGKEILKSKSEKEAIGREVNEAIKQNEKSELDYKQQVNSKNREIRKLNKSISDAEAESRYYSDKAMNYQEGINTLWDLESKATDEEFIEKYSKQRKALEEARRSYLSKMDELQEQKKGFKERIEILKAKKKDLKEQEKLRKEDFSETLTGLKTKQDLADYAFKYGLGAEKKLEKDKFKEFKEKRAGGNK